MHEYFFRRFYFLVADSPVGVYRTHTRGGGGQGTPPLGVIRRLRRPPPPGSDPLAGLFAWLKLAQPRKRPREEPRKKKITRKNPYSDTQISQLVSAIFARPYQKYLIQMKVFQS